MHSDFLKARFHQLTAQEENLSLSAYKFTLNMKRETGNISPNHNMNQIPKLRTYVLNIDNLPSMTA